MGWDPIAVIEGGVISYVRADHIGRPVFATNSTGAKVWTASYLPFGGVRTSTGTPITARFPGQWYQIENGLHQNWMRDYDPTTGRYIQADPLGLIDGASVYGYVLQNPGRWIDPKGEESTNPWPASPSGKKEFICGRFKIICEVDPHKGGHCSWSKKNGNGRVFNGSKTCIRANGSLCEGSAAPPREVLECLRERNYCPRDVDQPFSVPPVFLILPFILRGGGGSGRGISAVHPLPMPVY